MAAIIIIFIFAVLAFFLILYMASCLKYEIRMYQYCRREGYQYSPGWFRIWVRLAMGTSGSLLPSKSHRPKDL